jgi:hypothetical protein
MDDAQHIHDGDSIHCLIEELMLSPDAGAAGI